MRPINDHTNGSADLRTASRALSSQASNVTSQTGEDGIIAAALRTLPLPCLSHWCIEFGAWDGRHLSNTYDLVDRHGYRVVLIEGDRRKHRELCSTYPHPERAIFLNAYVGWSAEDNLDQLLSHYEMPADPDLLSIDVDGNDYHIWRALARVRPKLVLIEYNPTIPNCVEFVQQSKPDCNQGSSPASLVRLGKEKGYALIAVTKLNLLFVDCCYYHLFDIPDNSLDTLRDDEPVYLFAGYDGTIFTSGAFHLPWHGLPVPAERLQVLPGVLRRYPPTYSALQRCGLLAFAILSNPKDGFKRIGRHLRRRFAPARRNPPEPASHGGDPS